MNIVEKLFREHRLTETEYIELIKHYEDTDLAKYLADEALRLRREIYGDAVYVRGLIEFTNICKNDCFYCGIRKSNPNAERYRLTKEEILDCCENGYHLGYRTFVLQGGEDGYYTDTRLSDIVRTIKDCFPDCAVTLSVGERSFESYRFLKEAGADRYLLRHETADAEHYRRLHPPELSWENRMRCLRDLKHLGYQVGAGFMVGSPYQTAECLAKDLMFLQEFRPEMVGIGPFIPHHDTQFSDEAAGSVELTLFLLSVIRIMLPHVLLPATTALGTLSPVGRERGMLAGANVVMPNLSPAKNRKQYELYDNKICTGEEAAECRGCLENRMKSVGFRLVTDRGDYKP
ncbi:MAG: [FeFe] hydrogenase H-cluster radical SAM maturase HydE [Lachnospiraceae bacterium]|nr:[FeFe] hydrogenase H-cluster radical SAM maturase HydE [Lachnospiraceae bacterium]